MERLESKSAIFAVGGMEISKALTLLYEAEDPMAIVSVANKKDEPKPVVFTIMPFVHKAIAIIALIILSPFLLISSVYILVSSFSTVLLKQDQVGMRKWMHYLNKFKGSIQSSKEESEKTGNQYVIPNPEFICNRDPDNIKVVEVMRVLNVNEIPLNRLSENPGLTYTWQIAPQRNSTDLSDVIVKSN